jgi:hypothetical protein
MDFVIVGRCSLNKQILSELSLSEAYETFANMPQNVVKYAFEQVNSKTKKKANKKPKVDE